MPLLLMGAFGLFLVHTRVYYYTTLYYIYLFMTRDPFEDIILQTYFVDLVEATTLIDLAITVLLPLATFLDFSSLDFPLCYC